ncbi:tetratricopeptide repeat protein [Streptomyces sp. NPDC126510]|uniref:tetratricopeptide repeat protein n=1 Tax=Streptomyces sp. NPDC126510 TaxID=3155317 RepID=UPI00331B3311
MTSSGYDGPMDNGDFRFSLVIASQTTGQNLPTLPQVARELDTVLRDPQLGGCKAALPDGRSLLLDQDTWTTMTAVADAAERAQEGLLILAWIGHGTVRNKDFYVLPHGSTEAQLGRPDGPYHLPQQLKELFVGRSRLGLILLIDACVSGAGVAQAAAEWTSLDQDLRRRFQVLSAANMDESAWDCSFSRTIAALLRTGHIALDQHLVCRDLKRAAELAERRQQPALVSLDGLKDDSELWVANNAALTRQSLPVLSGDLDGLRRALMHFRLTSPLEQVVAASRAHRYVVVRGPAGFGKTTVMGALTRSEVAPTVVPAGFVHALRLLQAEETSGGVAQVLANQLVSTVAEFKKARGDFNERFPPVERANMTEAQQCLLGPLSRLPIHTPVRIALDGFDQLSKVPADEMSDLIRLLQLPRQGGADVRIVVSSRPDAAPPPAGCEVVVDAASDKDLQAYLDDMDVQPWLHKAVVAGSEGSWLVASLLADYAKKEPTLAPHEVPSGLADVYNRIVDKALRGNRYWAAEGSPVKAAFTVLAAAGPGAVLPQALLQRACQELGAPAMDETELDKCLEPLRTYVARAPAGEGASATMLYGLFHQSLADFLTGSLDSEQGTFRVDVSAGHRALAISIAALAPADQRTPANSLEPLQDYAQRAEPDHLWHCGEHEQVLHSLKARASAIPVENLHRWQRWHHELAGHFGDDDPYTLTTRRQIASWTGDAGHPERAMELFKELLPDFDQVLGPNHRDTLTVRADIAEWTGETGTAGAAEHAVELFKELLPDQVRALGDDDPDTLTTRHNMASWTGETGDTEGALEQLKDLLPDRERVLGADHHDTLTTQHEIAIYTGRSGEAGRAADLLTELVPHFERVLGSNHPDTLIARGGHAGWTGRAGMPARAVELFTELLTDFERVLGPDKPDTLITRHNIAYWMYEDGHHEEAMGLWREMLPEFVRVFGREHPRTQTVQWGLARGGGDGTHTSG